jgi:hypothetical protein
MARKDVRSRKTSKRPSAGEHRNDRLAQLDPRVRRWLQTPDPDDDDEDDDSDSHYDRWLLNRMSRDQVLDVGGVLVDKALLGARFACVPERCSPTAKRGRQRSCCADLTVYLTPTERARLDRQRPVLTEHLRRREPELSKVLSNGRKPVGRFYLDEDGDALSRPHGRCVFSLIDSRGRIRCHLHSVHRQLGIDQTDIQPVTCRIFPLVLCHLPRGKVLVTIVNRQNYRAWGGKHPRFFPCLTDPKLPPALESMGPTLDWLFGAGFARQATQLARADKAGVD